MIAKPKPCTRRSTKQRAVSNHSQDTSVTVPQELVGLSRSQPNRRIIRLKPAWLTPGLEIPETGTFHCRVVATTSKQAARLATKASCKLMLRTVLQANCQHAEQVRAMRRRTQRGNARPPDARPAKLSIFRLQEKPVPLQRRSARHSFSVVFKRQSLGGSLLPD